MPFSPACHMCRLTFRETFGEFWRQKKGDCRDICCTWLYGLLKYFRMNFLSVILWKSILKISVAFQFNFFGGVGWMSVWIWEYVNTYFQTRLCFLVGTLKKQETRFNCFTLCNDGSFDLLVFWLWLPGISVERLLSESHVSVHDIAGSLCPHGRCWLKGRKIINTHYCFLLNMISQEPSSFSLSFFWGGRRGSFTTDTHITKAVVMPWILSTPEIATPSEISNFMSSFILLAHSLKNPLSRTFVY